MFTTEKKVLTGQLLDVSGGIHDRGNLLDGAAQVYLVGHLHVQILRLLITVAGQALLQW